MRYGFGVDIFGPNIKFGFFDEKGELLDKWKIAHSVAHNGNQILPAVADEIESYMSRKQLMEDDIIGVGVGIPGPVNENGVVNKCVNFGWGVFNIDRALAGLTGLNVRSGNNANLSALGEYWRGKGSKNMVLAAMNTGLGGAVICGGTLVCGAHGGGGEIGHMIVNTNEEERCTCGRRGCAEQYCTPTGIVRLARRKLASSQKPSVLRSARFFDYKAVLSVAEKGDQLALEVMNQVYRYTGQALASVCCVTNPDTIVLGGEFCKIGRPALESIERHFHQYIFHANQNVSFRLAALDTDACIYGAFKLVLDSFA